MGVGRGICDPRSRPNRTARARLNALHHPSLGRNIFGVSRLSRPCSVASRPALRLRGGFKPSGVVVPRGPSTPGSELRAATGIFAGVDVSLILYFAGWYLGNYYYTLNNKYALKAAGGATGFPVTIGFLQMLLGSCYALYLWIAPDARAFPQVRR